MAWQTFLIHKKIKSVGDLWLNKRLTWKLVNRLHRSRSELINPDLAFVSHLRCVAGLMGTSMRFERLQEGRRWDGAVEADAKMSRRTSRQDPADSQPHQHNSKKYKTSSKRIIFKIFLSATLISQRVKLTWHASSPTLMLVTRVN